MKLASNGTNTIALAFTNGHPRNTVTNIYYAAYRDGSLWTAGGRRIASIDDGPISPQRADLVYDADKTGIRSWVWDVALDSAGRPVIVYATFPSPSRHVYWYATWTGRRWISHRMTVGGPTISPQTIEKQYSGGLALDHADPSIVYLSRKVRRVVRDRALDDRRRRLSLALFDSRPDPRVRRCATRGPARSRRPDRRAVAPRPVQRVPRLPDVDRLSEVSRLPTLLGQ